jgi:hypothetical protein
MIRDHEQVLKCPLDHASVRMVSDARGFVHELSLHWHPTPGGWFYSEEDETGIWVSATEG